MTREVRQLAKGSASALGFMLLGRGAALVLQVMLSRYLGVSAYGVVVLLTSMARLGQQVVGLGIGQGIVRFGACYAAANDGRAMRAVVRKSALLVIISSAICGTVLWLVRDRVVVLLGGDPRLNSLIGIALLVLVMLSILSLAGGVIRSQRRAGQSSLVREVITPVARIIIIGAIMLAGGQLGGVMWGIAAGTAVAVLAGVFYVYRIMADTRDWVAFPQDSDDQLKPRVSSLLRVSLPMFLSGFSYAVILYIDRFMIGFYLNDPTHVGVYHAAATIAMQMNVGFMACNIMFAPMIAMAYRKGDMQEFGILFQRIPWWAFLFSAPLLLAGAFNAKVLMSLFGSDFIAGTSVLIILLAAQAYNVFTGPAGVVLQMTGRQNLDMYINLALVVVNIVLNMVLIPKHGVTGAAMATMISVIAVHTSRLILVMKLFDQHPFSKRLALLGLVTMVGLLVGYWFAIEWSTFTGLAITLCSLLILALWLWLWGVDAVDRDIVGRAIRKVLPNSRSKAVRAHAVPDRGEED